jgi:hypothetical protein
LWSSYPTKGVANPAGIQRLYRKQKGQTLQKLYSSICSISGRTEAEVEKLALKIIAHAWRTDKCRLVMHWRKKESPFRTYKELREENCERFVAKCKLEDFAMNSQYMQWL